MVENIIGRYIFDNVTKLKSFIPKSNLRPLKFNLICSVGTPVLEAGLATFVQPDPVGLTDLWNKVKYSASLFSFVMYDGG
jgi:hypothetical protein